jgi:prepilin-type N-terminal cleavage/methylation domain-containing protein
MVTRNSKGFTLIEIAIVLVIIGLLLGGVLKGQELITGARVRNLISQQDGIKAAFFGFQDRYRALPGDYPAASTNINCTAGTCPVGDGNGRIEAGGTPDESVIAWTHLTGAGFMNGSYAATSATTDPDDNNTPKNPYSTYIQLIYDAAYGDPGGTSPSKHNLKTGIQVPVEIVAEVDRKIDDGRPYSGSFQYSEYDSETGAGPDLATTPACVDAGDNWNIKEGQTNCGAASLF